MKIENQFEIIKVQVLEVHIIKQVTMVTVQILSGDIKSLLIFEEEMTGQKWRMTGGPAFSNPNAWEKGIRGIVLKKENPILENAELRPGLILLSSSQVGNEK
jgi:hypothetical protein